MRQSVRPDGWAPRQEEATPLGTRRSAGAALPEEPEPAVLGPTETTLFMYGPDAERLFAGVEATLRAYPLCRGARVVIRRGGPGAATREVRL